MVEGGGCGVWREGTRGGGAGDRWEGRVAEKSVYLSGVGIISGVVSVRE